MADIKQAAKWISEGLKVRRAAIPEWKLYGVFGPINCDTPVLSDEDAIFDWTDLLAEDWEIDRDLP